MVELVLLPGLFIWSIEDKKTKLVDIRKVAVFLILGIGLALWQGQIIQKLLFALVFGAIFYLISIFSKEKIGKGDALVMMTIGIYAGTFNTIRVVWFASLLSALAGVYELLIKRRGRAYEMPFIPFLLGGYTYVYGMKLLGDILL